MQKALFIFCVLFSICLKAQTDRNDVKTVLENMTIQENCWNKGDIPCFMQYYWKSDSLKFIGKEGITTGWHKTIEKYLKSYPTKEAMGNLRFTIEDSGQLSPTSIYIIGKWQLQKEKPAGGYFTLLWKKIDGNWVIVWDHTS
jgi:hypothetical protein